MQRTREECKQEVINFLRKNPEATVTDIKKVTGVNIGRAFGGIEDAFETSGVEYPRRTKEKINKMKSDILTYLKKYPKCTFRQLNKDLKINFQRYYPSINEARKSAGIPTRKGGFQKGKIDLEKRKRIIEYIKQNPLCTQWEINKTLRTQVQAMYSNGIIDAYKLANITYPFHRRKKYGAANSHISKRARDFEEELNQYLQPLGEIQKRTSNGVADAVIKLNNLPYVIEIKCYKAKPISLSEAKQVDRYMRALKIPNGLIICKNPQKRRIYNIGKNRIRVMTKEEFLEFRGDIDQSGRLAGSRKLSNRL